MGIRQEARSLHAALRLWVLHKRFPDETRARIFGHQHGDSHVDADHVRVVPVRQRIKRIDKSISSPGPLSVFVFDRLQHLQALLRQEWQ